MIQVRDVDLVDELAEMADDHHVEAVRCIRDDAGNWYAEVSTDHGSYSAQSWWRVTDTEPLHEILNAAVTTARPLGDD